MNIHIAQVEVYEFQILIQMVFFTNLTKLCFVFRNPLPLLHNFVNSVLYGHVCELSKRVQIVNMAPIRIEKMVYTEFNGYRWF